MGRLGRWAALAVLAVGLCCRTVACSEQHRVSPPAAANVPVVRVRLMAAQPSVGIKGALAPTIKTASEANSLRLNLPPQREVSLALVNSVWQVGGVPVPGSGELTMWQADDATIAVNGRTYRGKFRFVPTGDSTFDVVNDVDIDSYLKSVIPRELYRTWGEEAYKAQAIVARTYALHEARTNGSKRAWDVYDDTRSQVYGGYGDETAKSRDAVDETAGIVVAYGPLGQEKIFKAYFSACCGGVTQSAADAFGENYFVPLSDQNVHGLCNSANNYNWGPIEIRKDDLFDRLRTWGTNRENGMRYLESVQRVEIQATNRFNRPVRFVVIDDDGNRFSLTGEELRNAINGGTTKEKPAKLLSSFVKVVNEPGSDVVRFVEGHGHGHGVGLCQWCSEIRAEAGMRHEDIVLSAYPKARLVRAY